MDKHPAYGDYLTFQGRSFRYIEPYDDGGWPHSRGICEAVDPDLDIFDDRWRTYHLHGDYFALYFDDCEMVTASDPQTFQGLDI